MLVNLPKPWKPTGEKIVEMQPRFRSETSKPNTKWRNCHDLHEKQHRIAYASMWLLA